MTFRTGSVAPRVSDRTRRHPVAIRTAAVDPNVARRDNVSPMHLLGPNTGADAALLRPAMLACAGEDANELARCFDGTFAAPPDAFFEYRCYRFWRFADATVVWTGIGTGCLEPMLWEVLAPGVVRDVILFGTAGRLPRSGVELGRAYCVGEAYFGGTAFDADAGGRPVRPRYPLPPGHPTASAVSTDFYYGFSPKALSGEYPAAGESLRRAVRTHLHARDLVEMETAPFYHLCDRFDRTGRLRFLSIKGAANDVTHPDEQLDRSQATLLDCLRAARALQRGGG
jgi:hypothetical protein